MMPHFAASCFPSPINARDNVFAADKVLFPYSFVVHFTDRPFL